MAVTQCLLDNNCIPVGMEQFPASGMSQMKYIEKMLEDCDYYILILAGRYGSVDQDGIGFTEKEYDYACQKGIPMMCFVLDNIDKLPIDKVERDDSGRKKQNEFRERVCNANLIKFYKDIGDLKAHVATSINTCIRDFPAVGWVRGTDAQTAREVTRFRDTLTISSVTHIYQNEGTAGSFRFDYSNNNGKYTIGKDNYMFVTRWAKASNEYIHAYNGDPSIESIARITGPVELKDKFDGEYDFSSNTRTAAIGDAIIWKNKHGKYAITKIISIADDSRGAKQDDLICEFVIYA